MATSENELNLRESIYQYRNAVAIAYLMGLSKTISSSALPVVYNYQDRNGSNLKKSLTILGKEVSNVFSNVINNCGFALRSAARIGVRSSSHLSAREMLDYLSDYIEKDAGLAKTYASTRLLIDMGSNQGDLYPVDGIIDTINPLIAFAWLHSKSKGGKNFPVCPSLSVASRSVLRTMFLRSMIDRLTRLQEIEQLVKEGASADSLTEAQYKNVLFDLEVVGRFGRNYSNNYDLMVIDSIRNLRIMFMRADDSSELKASEEIEVNKTVRSFQEAGFTVDMYGHYLRSNEGITINLPVGDRKIYFSDSVNYSSYFDRVKFNI